jgi:hypothetical protein
LIDNFSRKTIGTLKKGCQCAFFSTENNKRRRRKVSKRKTRNGKGFNDNKSHGNKLKRLSSDTKIASIPREREREEKIVIRP